MDTQTKGMDDDFILLQYADGSTIVNVELLRKHPLIQSHDARMFRWLSGLEEHPTMKKDNGKSFQETFREFLENFSVHACEYKMFQRYLVAPSHFHDMQQLQMILLKMGIFTTLTDERYNPMTPKEDVHSRYWWQSASSPNDLHLEGWSATVHSGNSCVVFFYRKAIGSG